MVHLPQQEKVPIEEVFEKMKCKREGLRTSEGDQSLEIIGPNKLEEKKVYLSIINNDGFLYDFSGSSTFKRLTLLFFCR